MTERALSDPGAHRVRRCAWPGTVDIDQRSQSWPSEGWTGYAEFAGAGAATANSATESRSSATAQTTNTTANNEEIIPVTEEQLRVGKREVSHGRVRVRSYVVETPVEQQVGLRDERVFVERRPVNRQVTGAENLFQDRVIEAEERTEEAVVPRKRESRRSS